MKPLKSSGKNLMSRNEREKTSGIRKPTDPDAVREAVRQGYASIATHGGCCGSASGAGQSCCGAPDPEVLAKALGYGSRDLQGLPEGANLGLSCGNPTAMAMLRAGETVLDLGSGAGFDVFVAARQVGATGQVIGVDMTPEMLGKARRNAVTFQQNTGLANVEFRLGEIEHLPVADGSIDVVISNCVLNLSPDKPQVWREIARVLKPGGRACISDLALRRAIPEAVKSSVQALVGCIAGAVLINETRAMIAAAGLRVDELADKPGNLDSMIQENDSLYREVVALLPAGEKPGDFVTSLAVTATKPASKP